MTREEAINFLKGYLDEEVYTDKCRNAHKIAIQALKQQSILDKIRTEIEKLNPVDYGSMYSYESHNGARDMKEDILDIIDRYKAESEVEV